jgi:rhamnulokinase
MGKYYLAIDIGASSGRHIIGWSEGGEIRTEEVYRFPNGPETADGHLVWDIGHLFAEVVSGIRAAFVRYPVIESLSIDTWGVDYVLLRGDDPILPCFAYRDARTEAAVGEVHRRVPFAELYEITGIQFQPFNTIYQLYADLLAGRLDGASGFLMVPEYLLWRLTGTMAHEYTNATTTGLVHAASRAYDPEIIGRLGLPGQLFCPLSPPGTALGGLRPDIAAQVGGQTQVMLCATHDTASAVEGIPMEGGGVFGKSTPDTFGHGDKARGGVFMDTPPDGVHECDKVVDGVFLSSGTWSLLGVKLPAPLTDAASRDANFSNEGGVGYIRYLKNIMGLWIIQCLQKQVGISFAEMVDLARTSAFAGIFDVNDARFVAPGDMRGEILGALGRGDLTDADILNSVYHSLAHSYHEAIDGLERNTGRSYDTLYIVGGGAKNAYLNDLTARYTGKRLVALPIEATAIGNLKVQMGLIAPPAKPCA